MPNKTQISVRLSGLHLKLLQGLQPLYGDNKSEVARHLLIDSLEEKHGLTLLRENKAIRVPDSGRLTGKDSRLGQSTSFSDSKPGVGRGDTDHSR